jgi:hypothetical protein
MCVRSHHRQVPLPADEVAAEIPQVAWLCDPAAEKQGSAGETMIAVHEISRAPRQPHITMAERGVGGAYRVQRVQARKIAARVSASVLLAACVVHYLASVSFGWRHAISDTHGFRQSQTAISVYTMLRGGPWLIYETPVLGPPWTIPFEFPLYQWLVAALAWSTGLALDPAGRTVSIVFFLLTLWPAARLLAALRVSFSGRLVILSLLLCSPFYIFWSRTFLIESTALFLATWSLACSVWAIRRPSVGRLMAMSVVGSLAAVVKITTFFPFLLTSIAVVSYQAIRRAGPLARSRWVRRAIWPLACAALPALALVAWTSAADHAKNKSILGSHLTSTNLNEWNFGTVKQRLSGKTWEVLASRMDQPLGSPIPFVVGALGLIMARRRLAEVAACLLLYAADMLVFTNLYVVHDYYHFANNLFLIAAVGLAIVAMFEAGPPLRDGAIAGLALLLGSMVFDYNRNYRPIQARNHSNEQRLGAAIRRQTGPDDVIVLLGFDWSSEVPYYSGRRALCLPVLADPGRVGRCLKTLAPYHIGAVAIVPPDRAPIGRDALLRLLRQEGFEPRSAPVERPFELLLPAARSNATGKVPSVAANEHARRHACLHITLPRYGFMPQIFAR